MANETKTYELVAEPREITGKASRKVRRAGMVPAVVYGHNVTSQSLQVPKKEFEQVYLRAGSNTLVDLKVGEGEPARKVFIHEVQRTAVSHDLTHIDFLAVNLREEMTTSVPVVLIGESPVIANNEGVLIHQTEYIQIKALPTDIPPSIEVDISVLDEIGKSIHVADLELPENVTLLTPVDDLIARVNELRIVAEEVEEEEAAEAEGEEAGEAEESAEAEGDTSEDES
jgi:large subunit ribosomal protein L25